VIGPGWLPGVRARPMSSLKRRTLAYTRTRRRSQRRPNHKTTSPTTASTELVLFAHGPAEFPIATVRARELRARVIMLVADLQRWFAARWQWLRPRTVPCAVACLGMIAILASADYLAHQHVEHVTASHVVHIDLAPH
jgi:hypothetical protein